MLLQRLALRAAPACLVLAGSAPRASAFEGKVSWYGAEHGQADNDVACSRRTFGRLAGRFNPAGMTAAHWTLPCGTLLRITDLATGRSIVVTVTDRGPHPHLHRAVDLKAGAADALGTRRRGVVRARIEILGRAAIDRS